MFDILRDKNGHGYDVFTIKTETGIFEIQFANNSDLYIQKI